MADHWEEIVTPATSHDLVTLDEAKMMLGIPLTDTSQDVQLAMMITQNSILIAEYCNRGARGAHTFGKETLIETVFDIGEGKPVWLSHYPIAPANITSVEANGALTTDYKLDANTGKLGVNGGSGIWGAPVIVEYTGGYELPAEAPFPLKQACVAFIREDRIRNQQAAVAGIRMVSHRDARVMFFDPNAVVIAQTRGGGGSPALQAMQKLLMKYTRIEI
jgi:hypothetical protein